MCVTEGEDKPLKYPTIYNSADLAVITKCDIAHAAGFDRVTAHENINSVRPGLPILETSARAEGGVSGWIARVEACRPARSMPFSERELTPSSSRPSSLPEETRRVSLPPCGFTSRRRLTERYTRAQVPRSHCPPLSDSVRSCHRKPSAVLATAAPSFDLDAHRARIPLLASMIPMNNCSQAPQTDCDARRGRAVPRVVERSDGMDWDAWIDEVAAREGGVRDADQRVGRTRSRCSAPCPKRRAPSRARSTSAARRNRVVVTEAEFPTIGHVWLAQERRGARVSWVPVRDGAIDPLDDYDPLIDDDTAIVSACHGYYLNGFMQDVARIAARAHAHGALLFVDAYQTLGTVPIDVQRARRRLPRVGQSQVPHGHSRASRSSTCAAS